MAQTYTWIDYDYSSVVDFDNLVGITYSVPDNRWYITIVKSAWYRIKPGHKTREDAKLAFEEAFGS